MDQQGDRDDASLEGWNARQRYWQKKLGRLRLGAEPLEEQLAKYRRVTWMLTAVPIVLALMFVGLFAAFGRPLLGVILSLVLLSPVVTVAWIDFGVLSLRASRYQHERERWMRADSTPERT